MKQKFYTLNILLVLTFFAKQTLAQIPQMSELQTTNAPGITLLDQTPASIDKPIDPKTFAISLYNIAEGGSIECTPYWLFNHKDYTFQKHLNNKNPILQTFNISLSNIKKDSISHIAFGFRTQLLKIYSKNQLSKIEKKVSDIKLELVEDEPDMKKLSDMVDELEILKESSRINIELAGAFAQKFVNNNYSTYLEEKRGAWLNAKYSPKNTDLDVVVLARYLYNNQIVYKQETLDFGTALFFGKDKFAGQLEYIYRFDINQQKVYDRLSFMLNYQVNDKIALVSSFGRNFDTEKNVFTMMGVKFGISNPNTNNIAN